MTQNVLVRDKHAIGYALLQCIASYLHYHLYIILNVHTETTIASGERELLNFQRLLEVSGSADMFHENTANSGNTALYCYARSRYNSEELEFSKDSPCQACFPGHNRKRRRAEL